MKDLEKEEPDEGLDRSKIKKVLGAAMLLSTAVVTYFSIKSDKKLKRRRKTLMKKNNSELRCKLKALKEVKAKGEVNSDYRLILPSLLYTDSRTSNIIPTSSVDVDEILKGGSKHTVHIVQEYSKKYDREVVSFLFEIPRSSYNGSMGRYSDGGVKISDFIRTIKGSWNKSTNEKEVPGFMDDMVKIAEDPVNSGVELVSLKNKVFVGSSVEPYVYISYKGLDKKKGWIEKTKMILADRSLYEKNEFNSNHTRATEFITDLYSDQEFYNNERNYVLKFNNPYESKVCKDVEVLDAMLVIRVSFFVQENNNLEGINSKGGLKMLEKIYKDLEIRSKYGVFTYDNFLFYSQDKNDVGVYVRGSDDKLDTLPIYGN